LGVTIRHINPGLGKVATYLHRHRAILIRPGLPLAVQRSVVAHELGHAAHNDQVTVGRRFTVEQECAADEWAAELLIEREVAMRSFGVRGCDIPAVAADLEVTERLLRVWVDRNVPARLLTAQ